MVTIIVELSKYILTALIAIYTIQCFAVFRFRTEEARNSIYLHQNYAMVLIHLLAFCVMLIQTGDINYFFLYIVQQATTVAVIVIYRKIYYRANKLIINNMCMLLTISFIILSRLSVVRARKQTAIAIAALLITFFVPFIMGKFHNLRRFYILFAVVGITFLGIVLIFSRTVYGSKLNFSIFGVSFQPSEYIKVLFVLSLAGFLAKAQSIKDVAIAAAIAGTHVILLVLSKDLGSAIIYVVVFISMVYVATHKIYYLLVGGACVSLGSLVGYKLFSHVRIRVKAFTDPFGTIDKEGYQIAQSLFAIGTGGLFGMGLFRGVPEKIPVVASDFVFSAISEEMGVIFSIFVIMICVSCFVMFMNISMIFNDKYYKLVGTGLAVTYGFQVFLTIGGVTKFIPLTGVTLPLVSYGGNSVFVSLIMFAIIQGLYVTRREYDYDIQ